MSWRSDDVQFGGGPEFTQRIRRTFREAALHDLDFEKCVVDARKKHPKLSAYVGFPMLRFYADLEGTAFSFTAEAVRAKVDEYAQFSSELLKLKLILDEIAYEQGRMDEVAKKPTQIITAQRASRAAG